MYFFHEFCPANVGTKTCISTSCKVTFNFKYYRMGLSKIMVLYVNQRTNGPVNAHLIPVPTVSTEPSFAKFDIVLKWVKVNSGSSFI